MPSYLSASDCPFCLAMTMSWPEVGARLVFLRGMTAGRQGIVVQDSWGTCPPDRFLVKIDGAASDNEVWMVVPGADLYLMSGLLTVPHWMPPASIEDNCAIHDSFFLHKAGEVDSDNPAELLATLSNVIETCWRRRLPLRGKNIWATLTAHGVNSKFESFVAEHFEFGFNLLVDICGRRPVKRRRIEPMSQGRYLQSRFKIRKNSKHETTNSA